MTSHPLSSTSKPKILKAALRKMLEGGAISPGDRIPSEPELIARFGVSRATVREAVAALEQEGWLKRVQGKGTFVRERPRSHRTLAVIAPYLYASESSVLRGGADVIPLLMQAIEHQARRSGLGVGLYLSHDDVATERKNLLDVVERRADAALVWSIGGAECREGLHALEEAGVPLVLVDRTVEGLLTDAVLSDHRTGARRATLRLLDGGFGSVAYVTAPPDNTTLRDRERGYTDAMAERGLPTCILTLEQELGDGVGRRNYDRARDLVKQIRFPVAVFASDAPRLALLSRVVEDMGICPEDHALGCFDEPYLDLPDGLLLVKVLQPLQEIGRRAVDLALGRIEGNDALPVLLSIPPEVLVSGEPGYVGAGPSRKGAPRR